MRYTLLLLFLWAGFSCQNPKELSPEKYVQWISSEDHGCIKSKNVKNVSIQVRYMPAEYLAYKEFSAPGNTISFDSVFSSYRCGLAFQVTLSADEADAVYSSLMYYGVASQEDIQARI